MRRKSFTFPVSTLVGSNISNIRAIFRHHKPARKYYPKLALTLIIVGIFEVLHAWERMWYGKKIRLSRMQEPPVFIIGFWRSGTTLLHNLLCQDPDASYTTTLQAVFPHMFLSQRPWLKPLINLLLPASRPFDNVRMDMDFPQEEEYGMTNVHPCSLYNFFQFPADFDDIVEHEITPEGSDRQDVNSWMSRYRLLIAKAGVNTGGKRYISKNPCNLARMPLLQHMFPQARFIFIYRNPYQVVESLYRFYLAVIPGVKLQELAPDFGREKIVKLYVNMMHRYKADKSRLTDQDLLEIRMEDFLQDKLGQLQGIYKTFQMGPFDQAKPFMEEYLRENAGYSRESYEIHPDTYSLVNLYAADLVTGLGYAIQTETPSGQSGRTTN
jgi:omega-hydroxy-beta-dihydromenaquinone-9 sulfotransferase